MVVTEIFDDDQEQAAHVMSLAEPPARPRRSRKKATSATEETLSEPSDAGLPKPARPSRKRKTTSAAARKTAQMDAAVAEIPAMTPPVVDDLEPEVGGPVARPRKAPTRRPRVRKTAAPHADAPSDAQMANVAPQAEMPGEGTLPGAGEGHAADHPPVFDGLIASVTTTPAAPQSGEAARSVPENSASARPTSNTRSRVRRGQQPAAAEASFTTAPTEEIEAEIASAQTAARPPVIEALSAMAEPTASPEQPSMPSSLETPEIPSAEQADSQPEQKAGVQADTAPSTEVETVTDGEQNEDTGSRRKRSHRGGKNRRRSDAPQLDVPQAALPPTEERLALLPREERLALPPTADLLLDPARADALAEPATPLPDEAFAEAVQSDAVPLAAPKPRSRSARRRAAAARRKAEAAARAQEAAAEGIAVEAVSSEAQATPVTEDSDLEASDLEATKNAKPAAERKMLVSVLPGELVEVVILEDNLVAEYYVEMVHQAKIRGNIYKGVVSNIDPNLQAAFVNFGGAKNGFLQIDEIHPEYWLTHHDPEKGGKYPPIQKVMKAGQEVLVQVVKEPNGSKGAFLTTWVSLAGRFLVLTPGQEQIGISRKVEDGEERNRLRELIKGLNPGEGLGAIVRTVSAGTSKTTLQKDLSYLKRVWKDIHKRAGTEKAPCLIYEEPGLASRAVRDYLSDDVTEVWVDDPATAESMRAMTSMLFPRRGDFVRLYDNTAKSMWEFFNVRKQLEQVHAREVTLPSGGRLVFDQTEALMAIDINSGKSGGKSNFEATALRTNLEAAESIARQLRLRDVGGQVVIDFIEMRDQGRCREVERTLHAAMKSDRARHDIGHMSSFGLLQIVRQRIGSSAISISQEPCPHCRGTGLRRNMEWQALQLLRELRSQMRLAARNGQSEYVCPLGAELAVYVLNHKRERLGALEKEFHLRLEIRIAPGEA